MPCPSCSKNTYIAAKRGHIRCVLEHVQWDHRTLCGAIRSGSREVYDAVKDLEPAFSRTPSTIVAQNAVCVGWLDVVQEHFPHVEPRHVKKMCLLALEHGYPGIAKYVIDNMCPLEVQRSGNDFFYSAVVSGNFECIDLVNDVYEKNMWTVLSPKALYAAAVSSQKIGVWDILTRVVPPTEEVLALSVAYAIDLKKYHSVRIVVNHATAQMVPLPPLLKNLCIKTRDVHLMRMLHTNNEEWPPNFSELLEREIQRAGPRVRVHLENIRDFAHSCGANKVDELMRIMKDVDMPPAKRQRFERLVRLF